MKKILVIIVMLLVLVMPLSALSDTSVTLNSTVSTMNGLTTIRWTSGEVPAGGYNVIVQALNPSGGDTLLQLAGTTGSSSISTGLLAPGKSYRVYIVDSSFNILDLRNYDMPSVPAFEDGLLKDTSIKVSFEMRKTNLDTYRKVNSFRASDMMAGLADSSQYPCLKYQMQMPQLAYERAFFVQLVFESPDGITYTDRAQDITFERVNNGYQTLWWDDAGIDFFNQLYSQTENITPGIYKIHLYWDGYWVNTSSFRVD